MDQRVRELSTETKQKLRDAALRRWAQRKAAAGELGNDGAAAFYRTPIISNDQRAALRARQGEGCAICRNRAEELVLDHSHESGLIRGLLCGRCNVALSWFRDDPKLLRQAATYLEEAGEQQVQQVIRAPEPPVIL
jgi:hypothetical protein